MFENIRQFIRHGRQAADRRLFVSEINDISSEKTSNSLSTIAPVSTKSTVQGINELNIKQENDAQHKTHHKEKQENHRQQQQQQQPQKHQQQEQQQQHHDNDHCTHHIEEFKAFATDFVKQETLDEETRRKASRKSIERYHIGEKLGEGAFSVVYKAIDSISKEQVAIKVIKKYQLDEKQRLSVLKEVQIMRQLNHPNIVRLIDFVENEQYYYIIQEIVSGGEIFNEIVKFTYFSEDLSRHVIIQVAEALLYMHEHVGIVHRDLKPENIFFKPTKILPNTGGPRLRRSDNPATKLDEGKFVMNYGGGGIGIVKIGDFGLSKQIFQDSAALKTPCGTIGYTAPEIVRDMRYSKEVDMWALGCVLYILLCGFPPFFNDSIEELTKLVAKGEFKFLSPWWDEISPGAKNCVSRLLTVNPVQRYNVEQFLTDPWILEFLNKSDSAQQQQQHQTSLHRSHHSSHPQNVPIPKSGIDIGSESRDASINSFDSVYSRSISNMDEDMDYEGCQGTSLKRFGGGKTDRALYTPAVIAMKEAFDISSAAHRMHEEGRIPGDKELALDVVVEDENDIGVPGKPQEEVMNWENMNSKPFKLEMKGATILARRNKKRRTTPVAVI